MLRKAQEMLHSLLIIIVAGVAAGAALALQTEELLKFAPVPSNVAYVISLLVGFSVGMLTKGMREGILLGLFVTLIGTGVLFLALYLPNIEIVLEVPEPILRSTALGGLFMLALTMIGIFLGRALGGE